MTAEERFQRDPHFNALVKSLYNAIREMHLTPTEVREAAMLAAVLYEQNHVRSSLIIRHEDQDDDLLPPFQF